MKLNELEKVQTKELSNVTPGMGITGILSLAAAGIGVISQFVSLFKSFKSTTGSYKTKDAEYKWDNNEKNAPKILENYILF
ncbi:hypothetical protein ACNQ2O_00060 [Mycoplasma sp. AA7A]|uniref:hypothetical protein n=1 Tax=unclassified Mycoplasma TaxID=2683645 RepID=UPI003AAE4EDD